MSVVALYGLISVSLVIGACVAALPIPWRRQAGIVVAAVAVLTVAPFLHALFGQISLSLTQIAVFLLIAPGDARLTRDNAGPAILVIFALVFYPLALGWGSFDPFGVGYQPHLVLLILIPVGLFLWLRRERILLLMISVDLIGYGLGLFSNLWNALFDPLLVTAAAIRLLIPIAGRARLYR